MTQPLRSTSDLSSVRSLLFAPGSDERKVRRALGAGADAVIVDLEDAVAPSAKDDARRIAASVLREPQPGVVCLVRINGVETEHHAADLAAIQEMSLDGIVLPKATPDAASSVERVGLPLIAIVETADGLRRSFETAVVPRVEALFLGAVDLAESLGFTPRDDRHELLFARSKLVMDSAAAGIRAPFDSVFVHIRQQAQLKDEAAYAQSLGFGGKPCIHPDQVPIVNKVFTPGPAAIEWAAKVVAIYEDGIADGRGATLLDGEMIDLPVVKRAQQILDEAARRT